MAKDSDVRLIKLQGESILIEVTDPSPADKGTTSFAPPIKGPIAIDKSLQQVFVDAIKPAAEAMLGSLKHLTEKPAETTVSFGVKLTSKADVIIASATVEANYIVTLKWTSSDSKGN